MVRSKAITVLLSTALICSANVPVMAKESKRDAQIRALLERPPEELVPFVRIEGDALDPVYKVSTQGLTAITNKGWLASTTTETSFLRAFVDKKTGNVAVQVYHQAVYGGEGWNFFHRATYDSPNGLVEVDAEKLSSDVSCASYGCTYYEDIAFNIPFETIEVMASKYDPANKLIGVKYRLFGKSGQTIDEGIPINEIVAFHQAVLNAKSRVTKTNSSAGK